MVLNFMFDEKIDILEDNLLNYSKKMLNILLADRTTKKNIIWATNDYYDLYCEGYESYREIFVESISGMFSNIIQPRVAKSKEKQIERTRKKAEVFTPAWVCNVQNNVVDEIWFGRKDTFNAQGEKSWVTNLDKIEFSSEKTWQMYVELNRLEFCCGEAPYLVSRYDNATGKAIELKNRIGILDRKLRVVSENASSKEEWIEWALRAVQSTYGFEYQGDNVLIARENILYTYIDYYKDFNQTDPDESTLLEVAKVISWNIWQMDGLTNKPPIIYSKDRSISDKNNTPYCKIKNWKTGKSVIFKSISNGK